MTIVMHEPADRYWPSGSTTLLSTAAIAVLLCLFGACSKSAATRADASVGCLLDSDCAKDQICNPTKGECVKSNISGCAHDGACPTGEICHRGKCQSPAPLTCKTTADCPAGLYCASETGGCVAQCAADGDCGAGEKCQAGTDGLRRCISTCKSDLECVPGWRCSEKVCVRCSKDDQCLGPEGAYCLKTGDSSEWRCVECVTSAHCTGSVACVGYSCVSHCDADEDCRKSNPAAPYCRNETCVECRTNDECRTPGKRSCGPKGLCVECLADAQCPSGGRCRGNRCEPACKDAGDCAKDPAGRSACDLTTHQCWACKKDDDCTAHGKRCDTDPKSTTYLACIAGCKTDRHCAKGVDAKTRPYCDSDTGQCVPCVMSKRHCQTGSICKAAACVDDLLCSPSQSCPTGNPVLALVRRKITPKDYSEDFCSYRCKTHSECPPGTVCRSLPEVDSAGAPTGKSASVCAPLLSWLSCTAWRSAWNRATCQATKPQECGNSGDENLKCLFPGVCSYPCGRDSHCPPGMKCEAQDADKACKPASAS